MRIFLIIITSAFVSCSMNKIRKVDANSTLKYINFLIDEKVIDVHCITLNDTLFVNVCKDKDATNGFIYYKGLLENKNFKKKNVESKIPILSFSLVEQKSKQIIRFRYNCVVEVKGYLKLDENGEILNYQFSSIHY